MRIAIVCYPVTGGSGVVATLLAQALARRGHHVHLISSARPFRLDGSASGALIHFHQVPRENYPLFEHPPYESLLVGTLVHVVRHYQVDLVHVHYAVPHAICALQAGMIVAGLWQGEKPLPVVTTLHGTDITIVGRHWALFPVVQYALRSSSGVTAVSRYLARETARVFGFSEITVIPNFLPMWTYDPERIGREWQVGQLRRTITSSRFLLLHVSNFRRVKRVDRILRVFARVRVRLSAHLLMIGDGPERENAERLAHELGIAHAVTFLGVREDIRPYLAMADLFVLLSDEESFGLSALEALAMGVPVVGTRIGGLPEVVSHGKCGLLFSPEREEEIAEGIVGLLQDRSRYRAMCAEARRWACRFDEEKIVARYEALYGALLRGGEGAVGRGVVVSELGCG